MSSCYVCGGTVGESCTCVRYTSVEDQIAGPPTLVESLTCVADSIRNLEVQLGARQYQVNLVWTRWTGGQRGRGNEDIIRVEPLLPVPMVGDLNGVQISAQSFAAAEVGSVRVSKISPRYNEDLLIGRDLVVVPPGTALPRDINFYWEIVFPRRDAPAVRRRFTVSGVPVKHPTKFEWVVSLRRASGDRTRDGGVG